MSVDLLAAIKSNDISTINRLIDEGVRIHDISAHQSVTPLQQSINQSNPQLFQQLISRFFASQHPNHLSERSLVIDQLTQSIYPNYQPADQSSTTQSNSESFEDTEDASMARVKQAIEAVKRGEFIVVTDGADRENEGDLIIAADCVDASKIAFMVNETSGIICVGVTNDRCVELELPQMVHNNTESHQTAFTVSVDYKCGTTTGISAADRAITIRALADKAAKPADFARPGHIFPLRARAGGVLERPGHTEASVDFARLAGFAPAGAMCEIVNKDGSMTRPAQLREWSKRHNLQWVTIKDLIHYRTVTEKQQ